MNLFHIIDKAFRKIPEWQLMDPSYRLNDDDLQKVVYNQEFEGNV